jgi:hypothetical protein
LPRKNARELSGTLSFGSIATRVSAAKLFCQ